jgi:hypothetical protein
MLNHARVPVMLPRDSDSDMCRDGSKVACELPKSAVDEHGRMHCVPNLEYCLRIDNRRGCAALRNYARRTTMVEKPVRKSPIKKAR